MTTWVIIATGQSLTHDQVEYVRQAWEAGKCKVAVVSNAYTLAPWADMMVSADTEWWRMNPEALQFKGTKYSRMEYAGGVKGFLYRNHNLVNGSNSGLLAMAIARSVKQASKLILLGFDMHGTHYFGPHPKGLNNTTPSRFKTHISQFASFEGPEVINCTPGSALKKFPMIPLNEAL